MMNRELADAFKPYVTTPEGRAWLAALGLNTGSPIVLCKDEDTVQAVFDRALAYTAAAPFIASLSERGDFRFMRVSPGDATTSDVADVDPSAPIGMLFDLTEEVHRVTVRLTVWMSVEGELVDDHGPEQLALV